MHTKPATTRHRIHTHLQICNLCEAMCGLKIQTIDGEITSIKGNPDDSFSKGYLCAKALALKDIHEDPDRLRQPVRRTAQGWETISWEMAFKDIKQQLTTIQKKFGRNSIALYLGNPRYHHHGSLLSSILLKKALNSRNCFSVASSDQLPHMLAAHELFGHMAMLPVPDIDRTDFLLCFGANPLVSNGSVMSAPNIKNRLKSLQNRGGKIITIDPRQTETAALADQHIYIRPGQDTFLLLGIIQIIFQHKLVDQGEWQNYTTGLTELKQLTQAYTLEKVARQTGIASDVIEVLALEFATSKTAAAYGRIGICTQQHGAINAWLIYLLNIISGNLDKPGGLMFPTPAADLALLSALINENGRFNEYRSRLKNLPSFDSELPVVEMADEMLSEEPEKIRAFINVAGNPVLSTPNGTRLEQALGQLDFMVAVDSYINETNRFADIILPPTSPLERSQYNMTCNLTAVRNNARYSEPLFPPAIDARHDWQILLSLSNILNRGPSFHALRTLAIGFVILMFRKLGADGVLGLMLRLGPYGFSFRKSRLSQDFQPPAKWFVKYFRMNIPRKLRLLFQISPFYKRITLLDNDPHSKQGLSLKKLKQKPQGIDLGAMTPCLPDRLKLFTDHKTLNLTPDIYQSELQKISISTEDRQPLANNEFILIGRRTPRSMNSWLHNVERLVKGKPSNTLFIHPENAFSLGISSGDQLRIQTFQHSISTVAELDPGIMKGVVCLPHGWGHHRQNTRLQIAHRYAGASFNDLTSSDQFDPFSGMSVLNNTLVKVDKASKG